MNAPFSDLWNGKVFPKVFPHRNEAPETAQGAGFSLAVIFDSHRLHIHWSPETLILQRFRVSLMSEKVYPQCTHMSLLWVYALRKAIDTASAADGSDS